MFDYLQQFNNLPKDLRDRVSSPSALAAITELENKYRTDLAMAVMKVMIKSLLPQNLPPYFVGEAGLAPETAAALVRELKEKVLAPVADYLGLAAEKRAWDLDKDIDAFIKAAGLVLPSAVLISRFKNILATYLRGVRSKIDTRNSLMKDVKIGGLNLSVTEIDRVLKICESHHFTNLGLKPGAAPATAAAAGIPSEPALSASKAVAPKASPPLPLTRLDKIMAAADKSSEYDLKQAIAQSRAQKVITPKPASKLDWKHELSAPAGQLDLPAASKQPAVRQQSAAVSPVAAKGAVAHVAPAKSLASSLPPLRPTMPTISSAKTSPALKKIGFWSKLISRKSKKIGFWSKLINRKSSSTPAVPKAASVPTSIALKAASSKPVSRLDVKSVTQPAVKFTPQPIIKPVPLVKPVPKPAAKSAPAVSRPAPAASSSRPQMHDIKPVPKVMGPIEELQFLDLVNFRRLGATPAEITAKILGKIKLLERDGYDKMVAGVRAWRQSPVSRLYLRLGQEAAATGLPFKDAIAARQAANQEYLNMSEVEAIVSLNSKLMF
jgi:hypothetical protein